MIFQDPMTSLNPYLRIEDQIVEPLLIHEKIDRREAAKRAVKMLEEVGVPDAAKRIRSLSARVFRRHAPARHDRHGAHHQA